MNLKMISNIFQVDETKTSDNNMFQLHAITQFHIFQYYDFLLLSTIVTKHLF